MPGCELLIHIGLHKTGTTWLQNRVFSQPKFGFSSPWGRMASVAVREFVRVDPLGFDARTSAEVFRSGREDALAEGLVPVISHEALSSRPIRGHYYAPVVADRLHQVFPDARIVIGIREQRSMLLSLFRQHVRMGGRECLQYFIGTGEEPVGWGPICSLEFLYYDRIVDYYTGLFGPDRVLVLPIELLGRDRRAYQNRLAEFAGVPEFDSPELAERSNVGWGGSTLAVQRRMNRFLIRNRLGPDQPLSVRSCMRVCYKLDRVLPRAWDHRVEARWKSMVARRVGDTFAQSNARLARTLGCDLAALGYDVA